MKVVLNGRVRELVDGASVEAAVAASGAPSSMRGIAVAVEGEVVPRGEWKSRRLREGQQVEVLQAVQGGS